VAKKLGDGLTALFGYPVAQENDAERAVRAALALHRALAELNRSTGNPALAARIAIDSGPVVASPSLRPKRYRDKPRRDRATPPRRAALRCRSNLQGHRTSP
jgi:class 3 adenylate cyclase